MTSDLTGFYQPLEVAAAVNDLVQRAQNELGVTLRTSSDFNEFAQVREEVRGKKLWPYVDPAINDLNSDNALWVQGMLGNKTVYLHAFRCDTVDSDFRNWCINLSYGLHARAGYEVSILEPHRPPSDRVRNLRGRLCLQAELWVGGSGHKFKWRALDLLPRIGVLLAYIQWQPEAIWALVNPKDVARGGVHRAGNPHTEPDFLVWTRPPDGLDYDRESLSTLNKSELETMIGEMLRTTSTEADETGQKDKVKEMASVA